MAEKKASASSSKVILYESSVAGNIAVKKNQEAAKSLLKAKKVEFQAIDISLAANSEAKKYMHQKSKNKDPNSLPQLFVSGEYRGGYDEMSAANEEDTFASLVK